MARFWRGGASGVAAVFVVTVAVHGIAPAHAQFDGAEQIIKECMDNGFSREECVQHAERVHNAERSSEERYQQEQRRHLEELSRPARPRMQHPGRRGITRP